MYVWILHHDGEIVVHRNRPTRPAAVLKTLAPYREQIVMAVACIFTGYGRADLCAREERPVVLGHALSMQAMHGGKAQHDKMAAQNIAVLLRGAMRPQASGSPAAMRATRDLLRRRIPRMRKRAELWTHVPHTPSQDHLPEIGNKSADQPTRPGGAERLADPAVQKSVEVDLALLD